MCGVGKIILHWSWSVFRERQSHSMQAPFNKMVRKGFSQLMLSHVLSSTAGPIHNLPSQHDDADSPGWQTEPGRASGAKGAAEAPLADAGWQGSVGEEAVRDALRSFKERKVTPSATSPEITAATEADFERMVRPGLLLGSQCGNMYTGKSYRMHVCVCWVLLWLSHLGIPPLTRLEA